MQEHKVLTSTDRDIDTFDLFPLAQGQVPPSSAIMRKLKHVPEERRKIFLLDEYYNLFRENKVRCRVEGIHKYYKALPIPYDQKKGAANFIVGTLVEEYPTWFKLTQRHGSSLLRNRVTGDSAFFDEDYQLTDYSWGDARLDETHPPIDLFDWLGMQVACDLVLFNPYQAVALHLMSPSGWSAEWALGKTFGEIHQEVTTHDKKPVIKDPDQMVQSLLAMNGAIERIGGMSFRSAGHLSRHPADIVPDEWKWDDDQRVFLRFERQTVMPLNGIFLFTIRTFFSDLRNPKRTAQAIAALNNIHPNTNAREFLAEHAESLKKFLERKALPLM